MVTLCVTKGVAITLAFLGTELASAWGITSYGLLPSEPPQNLKQPLSCTQLYRSAIWAGLEPVSSRVTSSCLTEAGYL